jgi:hypothetical protein
MKKENFQWCMKVQWFCLPSQMFSWARKKAFVWQNLDKKQKFEMDATNIKGGYEKRFKHFMLENLNQKDQ